MYRKICAQASSLLTVFDDLILNLRDEEGPQKHWLSELSLDGAMLSDAPIPDGDLQTIGLECGQCMVEYGSGGESSLICFSPAGESLVSIEGLGGYPEVIPRGGHEFYLLGERLVRYDSQTLQHEDLGSAPWEAPTYQGACVGFHLLTEAWQTRLLALRDLGGRGLGEVWRLDLSESDRHVGWKGPERGKVNWLNLYGDDVWATSHRRTYRLDAATGRVREVRDYLLPRFLVEGGIGYALCPGEFRAMDMDRGVLLREGPRLSFPLRGEALRCGFKDLCLHNGILYVSVSLWSSGLHLLAAFDVQAERFVWHDAWGAWPIRSVHILGDRLIADSRDEVRIYVRE